MLSYILAAGALLRSSLVLAAPDPTAPFPIAQSTFGPNQESMINNDIQSYIAEQTGAAYSSAATVFATDTALADLLYEYNADPNNLAIEFFTATATPTWYSALPTNLQQYVQGLASGEASIFSKDAAASVSEPPSTTATGAAAATTSKSGKNGAAGFTAVGEVSIMAILLAAGVAGVVAM